MSYVMYLYRGSSRDLKKNIVTILKSWMARDIKKLNYVQNYKLNGKNIQKEEVKIILVCTDTVESLEDFMSKNFSQMEKIRCD